MSADSNDSDGAVHYTTMPVRWSDFDRHGHIMNANYLEFAQEARLEYGEHFFFSKGLEFNVFVRRIEADYFRPIQPDTTHVHIETQAVEVGTTSFVTRQEIKDRQKRLACVVETVQVAIDMSTLMPRELTQAEIGIITQAPEKKPPADIQDAEVEEDGPVDLDDLEDSGYGDIF